MLLLELLLLVQKSLMENLLLLLFCSSEIQLPLPYLILKPMVALLLSLFGVRFGSILESNKAKFMHTSALNLFFDTSIKAFGSLVNNGDSNSSHTMGYIG